MKVALCSQKLTQVCEEQSRFNEKEQTYVARYPRFHEGLHVSAGSLFNTNTGVPSADALLQKAKEAGAAKGGQTETLYRPFTEEHHCARHACSSAGGG